MDLQVSCMLGERRFTLQNPIMPAPGSYGNVIEFANYEDLTRLGALVPNSMLSTDGSPSINNKFARVPCGFLSAFGPNNISLQTFIDTVLDRLPDRIPVIVDLKSRSMEEMAELAALAAQTPKIAAIEVNLTCPYGVPGPAYWQDPAQLEKLLRMVRESAGDKTLIAKGAGGLYPLAPVIHALEETGVDMFVPFNCISGLSVDIYSRTTQGGGYFGPGIKPIGLSICKEAASLTKMPVIGAGGITCAKDVLEYIMAGAFAVQVGSANLTRPDFMGRLLDDLAALMQELGIKSLNEVCGVAAPLKTALF